MFAYCLNNPIMRIDPAGTYSVSYEISYEGGSASISDKYSTIVGTITVIVTVDVDNVRSIESFLGGFNIDISTTGIEIETPANQTLSFSYDSSGVNPDDYSIQLFEIAESVAANYSISEDGFGVGFDTTCSGTTYSVYFYYKPSLISVLTEKMTFGFPVFGGSNGPCGGTHGGWSGSV